MATARPIIYTEVEIADSGGANGDSFDKHLVDAAELTLEPTTSMVEDGQSLNDFYDASFQVDLYDLSILDDARVNTDASVDPTHSDITFKGASGSADRTLKGVYVNGTKVFDGNRTKARITGSKRAVRISDAVDETNVA